jgi:putative ABC transport system substrate-binding protein
MGYSPDQPLGDEMQAAKAYAMTLGLDVAARPLRDRRDIAPAFESLKGRADALYIAITAFTTVHQAEIVALALGAHLPSVTGIMDYVVSGALISYGTDIDDLFRRAGDTVDRIQRSEKPDDLPFQQSTKFELAINLKTAKALDLVIPSAILAAAGEVIE